MYQNNLDKVDGGVPNDVALIEMDEPVFCTDYVQPACLPDDSVDVSALTYCYVSGWGTMDVPTQKQPDIQQEVRVDMIPRKICGSPSAWNKRILDENLCAGRMGEEIGICQGDSGGPLMCREERSERYWVVGISSWTTVLCGNPQFPGVFTSTQYHMDWIKRHTKDNFLMPGRPPLLALFPTPTVPNTTPKPHINTQSQQSWNSAPPKPPPILRPTSRPRPPILYLPRPVPTQRTTGWPQRPVTRPPARWSSTTASWLRPTTRWASTYRPWRTTYLPWTTAATWPPSRRPLTWFGLTRQTRATQRWTPSALGYSSSYSWRRPPPNPGAPPEKQ
uniref:Acrosin n=1 Tax=Pogona vitticeps TaxID=103695 RepID=A0A6J0SJM4_9SAUR